MKRMWMAAMVIGITTLGVGTAWAGGNDPNNPTKQCLADARATAKTCNQMCKDDFLASADSCRNLNHDCADTARSTRESCVSDVLASLDQCVTSECKQFDDDIAQCRANNPPDSAERARCVGTAQLQKFLCRKQCRDSVDLFQGLKTCRDEFRTDIQACQNPAPTPMSGNNVMGP
jgi:hypothetical protein